MKIIQLTIIVSICYNLTVLLNSCFYSVSQTACTVYLQTGVFMTLQDLLGGRALGPDREFGPERETAPDPRQPGVPPVRPHAGTPSSTPPHPQLSITGLTPPPGCLLHSPALSQSSAHRVTLPTGRLSVLQLMLNPFDLTISPTSLPL